VLLVADIDLDRLQVDRNRTARSTMRSPIPAASANTAVRNSPRGQKGRLGSSYQRRRQREPQNRARRRGAPVRAVGQELRERCDEIFQTQVSGLAKRLEHIGSQRVAIGVSGDSIRRWPCWSRAARWTYSTFHESGIKALTMPGFGTTSRTLANARR